MDEKKDQIEATEAAEETEEAAEETEEATEETEEATEAFDIAEAFGKLF